MYGPMLRRRRQSRRRARELARLLVALDTAAADARPWQQRRLLRASVAAPR
jgi:hypothetical protein